MMSRYHMTRIVILALLATALSAGPARAFKWNDCPAPPVPVNPSTLGASSSPFIQPGRALSIYLNEVEAAASGGFSTAIDGNVVHITFASLFGDAVVLSPRNVAAVSPGVLTFPFPDGLDEVGRTLAGPVQITVETNGVETAHIDGADLVALPASTDLGPYMDGSNPDITIGAAIDAGGNLWIPAFFSGKHMGMPGCEGNFVMPMPLEIGGATVVGDVLAPFDPATRMRQVRGYIGRMVINDYDFYGYLVPQKINLVQVGDTLGVSVCRLNDAEDLILEVQGSAGLAAKNSPYRIVARDSSPLPLQLHKAPAVPRSLSSAANTSYLTAPGRVDSFGNQCATLPVTGNRSTSAKIAR